MTAEELLIEAAKCMRCNQPHQRRITKDHRQMNIATWAAEDGHPYRPRFDLGTIDKLRTLIPRPTTPAPAPKTATIAPKTPARKRTPR